MGWNLFVHWILVRPLYQQNLKWDLLIFQKLKLEKTRSWKVRHWREWTWKVRTEVESSGWSWKVQLKLGSDWRSSKVLIELGKNQWNWKATIAVGKINKSWKVKLIYESYNMILSVIRVSIAVGLMALLYHIVYMSCWHFSACWWHANRPPT